MKVDSSTWCDMEFGLSSEKQFVCASNVALDSSGVFGTVKKFIGVLFSFYRKFYTLPSKYE